MKLILLLLSTPVFAGWISSGGQLFRDAYNPWFVRNTPIVKYCIEVETSSISQSQEVLERLVVESFEYWKRELSSVRKPSEDGHFQLGQQEFKHVACDDSDLLLRFVFGYEKLSKKEVEFLKDPRKYLGVAVRKSYDEVNLRGEGIIFISSDLGPNSYYNEGPDGGHLVQKAWRHPRLLKYVLIHELGHVFGMPHMGTGLMSEVFMDQLLNKKLSQYFLEAPMESFLTLPQQFGICTDFINLPTSARNWLGLKEDEPCVRLVREANKIKVYSTSATGVEIKLIGELKRINPDLADTSLRQTSVLQLTQKQKVFSYEETAFRPFMYGPLMQRYGSKAVYMRRNGGRPAKVYLKITPQSFTMLGEEKGSVFPVLIYNSPLVVFLLLSPNI